MQLLWRGVQTVARRVLSIRNIEVAAGQNRSSASSVYLARNRLSRSLLPRLCPAVLAAAGLSHGKFQPHRTITSMSSGHSMARDSKTGVITVSPRQESDQTATVVICHGLGDTAEGFADVAQQFSFAMPHVKFILPTAPNAPVTMNMGMIMPSWYDIAGLDERSNEKCDGIQQSRQYILDLIQAENKRGIPYSRMVLAGFSQGGALSLFTGLQMSAEQRLAGICVLSGYLAASNLLAITPGLESTPIMHCHGTQDPLVQHTMAEKGKKLLTETLKVSNYTLKSYPIQHTVSQAELTDVLSFLLKVLPQSSEKYVQQKDPKTMSVAELKETIERVGLGPKAAGLAEKRELVDLLQLHLAGK